jgi:hypothetical protein
VGTQYPEESPESEQLVGPPRSEAGVDQASTVVFPMNVWLWERPGWPGKTIGSSFER